MDGTKMEDTNLHKEPRRSQSERQRPEDALVPAAHGPFRDIQQPRSCSLHLIANPPDCGKG